MIVNRLVRYLGGNVKFEAKNGFGERLINLCANNNIGLWDLHKSEEGFTANCLAKDYREIKKLSKRVNVEVKICQKRGFVFQAGKYRKRWGLFVGGVLFFAFIFLSQCFVWEIDVTGNEKVADHVILAELEELGVHKLSFIPSIDFRQKKQEALLRLPQLSWLTINKNGCRLTVDVTERQVPPVIRDTTAPCDVVAARTGQIKYMEIYNGVAATGLNYTVNEGDVIVSGTYVTKFGDTVKVHADAKVIAEVQFEKSISLDIDQLAKEYTGKTRTRYYFSLFSLKIPLFIATPVGGDYDVNGEEHSLVLFGQELPLGIYSMHYRFYEKKEAAISMEEARAVLQDSFSQYEATDLKDMAIIDRKTDEVLKDGILTMTVHYTAEENIAKQVEIDPTIPPKAEAAR